MSVSNFFKSVQKIWNRKTLADGTLFDEEFGNLYSNFDRIVDKGDLPVHNSAPATSSVIHVTNQATGQSDSDGLRIEVGPSGEAVINQQENQSLVIKTNNSERVVIGSDDAMKVDTISERTLNNGVNIEGVNLKDGEITGGGWIDARETWTFAGADSPTFIITTPGDKTAKYSTGMKLKLNQEQALTSYWSFDSNLNDMVGVNHGTAIGGAAANGIGKFYNSLLLNGSNQAVSINDSVSLRPTNEFTIGAWIKTGVIGTGQIFQSYSANLNYAGIVLYLFETSGRIKLWIGKNSGTVYGTDYSEVLGKTNVCDNNWHYVTAAFRNNWAQLYVDGNLDGAGYCVAPAYAATNYVRIGCLNSTGTNVGSWFNGLIDDVFLINGYALDEQTIKAKYLAAAAQGTGNIPINKSFFISASPVYSGGNTTITLYGGTDYTLTNSSITNPYYSMLDQPFGWQGNPAKWTIELTNTQTKVQNTPAQGVWYGGANAWSNGTNITFTFPIGIWKLETSVFGNAHRSGSTISVFTTLSTSDNNESNNEFTMRTDSWNDANHFLKLSTIVFVNAKVTYYLLTRTGHSSVSYVAIQGEECKTIIRAKFFKA